jgi:ribosomal protein L35AE/L33A
MRKYAPGEYKGTRVDLKSLKRKQEREKLVGKRIGYDQYGSCMMHYGRVTGTWGRSLFVDGSPMDLYEFEQIVILDD